MEKLGTQVGELEFLLERPVVDGQPAFFQGLQHGMIELFDIDRLGQVIVGSSAQTVQRSVQIGIAGDHQDAEIRIPVDQLRQNVTAAPTGQADIEYHQSDGLLRQDKIEFIDIVGGRGGHVFVVQEGLQQQ